MRSVLLSGVNQAYLWVSLMQFNRLSSKLFFSEKAGGAGHKLSVKGLQRTQRKAWKTISEQGTDWHNYYNSRHDVTLQMFLEIFVNAEQKYFHNGADIKIY